MPLYTHSQADKSLPDLPSERSTPSLQWPSLLSHRPTLTHSHTIPLKADAVQNCALFGGSVKYDRGYSWAAREAQRRFQGGDPYAKSPELAQRRVEDGDSSSIPSKPTTNKRSRSKPDGALYRLFRTWWLEGVSIVVMVLCLFAIVLTLRMHQDQPLPRWKRFSGLITINALLSVYYTIFKGAMLLVVEEVLSQLKWSWFREPRPLLDLERFSEASRGPKGAVQLLWTMKARLWTAVMPAFGALLILFALLIDPFTQQIVSFYSCPREAPELTATVPRTNNFSSPLWTRSSMTVGTGGTGNIQADVGLQGSVYAGLLGGSTSDSSYVPPACPSGNCTFDPYWSLGMCSSCKDTTLLLRMDCKPYSWWNASSIAQKDEEWNPLAPLCNYTWPGEVGIEPSISERPWPQFNMTFGQLVTPLAGTTIVGRDTGTWAGDDEPAGLASIATGSFARWLHPGDAPPFSNESSDLDELERGIGAAQCILYPCIREYRGDMRGGTFKEETMSSSPVSIVQEYFLGQKTPVGSVTVRVPCLVEDERKTLSDMGYLLDTSTKWLAIKGPDFFTIGHKVNDKCVFSMIGRFYEDLNTILQNILVPDAYSNQKWQGVYGGYPDWHQTSTVLEAFHDYGYATLETLSARFQGMAGAMTSFMRRNPGDVPSESRIPANGTAVISDTCVAVDWYWILLPVSLVSLAVSYFVVTICLIARAEYQNMWKSSSVATLYHGLDPEIRSSLGSLASLQEMESAAQILSVQLRDFGSGWRFTKVDRG